MQRVGRALISAATFLSIACASIGFAAREYTTGIFFTVAVVIGLTALYLANRDRAPTRKPHPGRTSGRTGGRSNSRRTSRTTNRDRRVM